MAKRYGKLPHELMQAPIDGFFFDMRTAAIGLHNDYEQEKKAHQRAKAQMKSSRRLR